MTINTLDTMPAVYMFTFLVVYACDASIIYNNVSHMFTRTL